MSINIIGLGPGSIDDLSLQAWRTLDAAETVYLRTERHPCVPHLPENTTYQSFDHLYEQYDDFADVYRKIVEIILEAAETGEVYYAVPGDPMVGEATVAYLQEAADAQNISVHIIHGISFIEPMLAQAGIDALDGLQIIDGLTVAQMHHPPLNPDTPTLIAQVYSRQVASDVKLTLMNAFPDDFAVKLIHGAGADEMLVEDLPLYEIDRSPHINHLTSLYVPAPQPYTSFQSFEEVVAHLRAPEGCPWDRKQTHESLRTYLLEETHEVLEAIDNEDFDELAGELGDLLLQIVLHTQIAIEEGEFYMRDVIQRVNEKMIRRHPHVWGDVEVNGDADQVLANWEDIKKQEHEEKGEENQRKSLLDGVPKGLPAVMVTYKYTEKAAKVGFDWDKVEGVEDKVREELAEIFEATDRDHKAEEIGDLITVLINWLRWLDIEDPESLLRETNAKFYRRFRYIEEQAEASDRILSNMTLEEMDALWDEAKSQGL